MELKKYQQAVLDDLDLYIEELDKQPTIKAAFRSYWANKGVSIDSVESDYLRPYNDEITGVPNVTIKVPTAGGKTYLACKSIRHIFQTYTENKPKVVVWFVPSDPILKQTYKNLNNPNHPYRHTLDVDFGNKVQVINKESALVGENIRPSQLKENLTIFVLSVQSFASNNKEGRKARRENENLAEHVSSYTYNNKMLANADETSLLQVIAQLNPVMVIDESHNFESSDLRIELKKEINPSFIFNLTATPKTNSNIISFVDAMQLKLENMVKLPVIVYNHKSTTDVITNAIILQRSLEEKAKRQQIEKNVRYIRPIVLFQAQPKTSDDNVTFEKLKAKLIEGGIPEEQVKIKTAEIDEIKNIDLMSESCEVRFIITVNALKEGWDCPFAYILASLANKSARIDVEQILGRVLRLPYTKQQPTELLNLSYVFTCQADFQDTLKRIVESLNNAGFSKRDFRVANDSQAETTEENNQKTELPLFSNSLFVNPITNINSTPTNSDNYSNTTTDSQEDDFEEIEVNVIKHSVESNSNENSDVTKKLEESALQQSNNYNEAIAENEGESNDPVAQVTDMNNNYPIKTIFADTAKDLSLPIFVQKVENFGLFGYESEYYQIEKSDLLEGLDLSIEDHKIDFTRSSVEMEQIDLVSDNADGSDSVPIHKQLNMKQLEVIKQQLLSIPLEGKKRQLAGTITMRLNIQELSEKMVSDYIYDCIKNLDNSAIDDLITFQLQTIDSIKLKIKSIMNTYRYKTFKDWLDVGRIKLDKDQAYTLPKHITVTNKMVGVQKGLYKEEDNVNGFESKVISVIANDDNVEFWHRNQERGKGYFINGFINHYPDFIVKLKSGQILLIETKGDDRDNSDSVRKLELGQTWANAAGENFRYYMVFDNNPLTGAITINDLIKKISSFADNI